MAVYATYNDLVAKYGADFVELCFDRDGIGSVDQAAVDANLADASALIDTYLSVRYSLPLNPVPPILVALCRDIAVYYGAPDAANGLTDEKRKRFDDAKAWLQAVADNKADIGAVDTNLVGDNRALVMSRTDRPVFSRDSLRGVF